MSEQGSGAMCGANGAGLPPPWLTGDAERPAGEKTVGTAKFLVYTEEQQARLGVDENGKATARPEPGASADPVCKDVRPLWVKNGTEPPAGSRNMGSWTMAVFTEEQQARLGVDENGNPKSVGAAPTSDVSQGATAGTIQVIPAWVKAGIEPPAGEVDMGGWVRGVYTDEQMERLGVDEYGEPLTAEGDADAAAASPSRPVQAPLVAVASPAGKTLLVCGDKDLRPAWMRNGLTEAPEGRKNMGTWTAAVYTNDQQRRLGVDESGNFATPFEFSALSP